MSHSLDGKVVLVAGGAKNLGGLISRDFANSGAKAVAIHYNSDASRAAAEETAAAVTAAGAEAWVHQADLTKADNVAALFEGAKSTFGAVDIAVNTVGKVLRKPIIETSESEYDSMMDVNAKSAYFFLREVGKHANDGGKAITIVTSLLAAFTDGYSTYAGGKAPVEDFTRAAAKEFGTRGISVNSIGPGPMDTPFFFMARRRLNVCSSTGRKRWVTSSLRLRISLLSSNSWPPTVGGSLARPSLQMVATRHVNRCRAQRLSAALHP